MSLRTSLVTAQSCNDIPYIPSGLDDYQSRRPMPTPVPVHTPMPLPRPLCTTFGAHLPRKPPNCFPSKHGPWKHTPASVLHVSRIHMHPGIVMILALWGMMGI